jgi:hypothetical protein
VSTTFTAFVRSAHGFSVGRLRLDCPGIELGAFEHFKRSATNAACCKSNALSWLKFRAYTSHGFRNTDASLWENLSSASTVNRTFVGVTGCKTLVWVL